jgi:hypothetical protein
MEASRVGDELGRFRDPEIRMRAVKEALCNSPPGPWVQGIATTIRRAHATADPTNAAALEALLRVSGDPSLPYSVRQTMYEAAMSASLPVVARLFMFIQAVDPSQLQALGAERPLRPRGKPLSLGERKSLARSNRRDLLTIIARDPHPDVVEIFLGNPGVTEDDIVRIAAQRPAFAPSLAKLGWHVRWSTHHPVKRALVWNPMTPIDVAIRMATALRPSELRAIAADHSLRPLLRTHATEVLQLIESAATS